MVEFLVLVKLFKKYEHAQEFLNGKLHCNRIKYFRDKYDDMEGVALIPTDKAVIKVSDADGKHLFTMKPEDFAGPIEFDSDRVKNCSAFCMFSISNNDSDSVIQEKNGTITKYTIPPRLTENFGEHAVAVYSPLQFFQRIHKAAKKENYPTLTRGFVKYYNTDNLPSEMHLAMDFKQALKTALYKDEKFRHEREYRFLVETGTIGDEAIKIDIGDINDIAMYVKSSDLILTREIQEETNL